MLTENEVREEYLDWSPEDSRISIHMHRGAVDGIARDVLEGAGASPDRDVEVGGLLLGRVESGERRAVWIERYQRISCEYAFGPHCIVGAKDATELEEAATRMLEIGEMAVVGLYRSHTRPGLQLDESDFDLVRRYLSDTGDLVLLIKPGKGNSLIAQFYTFDEAGGAQPVGEGVPFRGNVVTPDTARTTSETPDEREKTTHNAVVPDVVPPKPQRRLVPDFPSIPAAPLLSQSGFSGSPAAVTAEEQSFPGGFRKWLPLFAALLLVGSIVAFFVIQGRGSGTAPVPIQGAETVRPLGLYVDTLPRNWRVLWNTNATALHDARTVQLFVREVDDQNRVELSAKDLAAGSYDYKPTGTDVTFRLEVVDKAGQISAESFRLFSKPAQPGPSPPVTTAGNTQPKPTHRVPPVVATGIRSRIRATIPIDIRVRIDERGRVTSASPITRAHGGLHEYLTSRAVQAARQWRFEPARENGRAVAGTQTIHFVFTN